MSPGASKKTLTDILAYTEKAREGSAISYDCECGGGVSDAVHGAKTPLFCSSWLYHCLCIGFILRMIPTWPQTQVSPPGRAGIKRDEHLLQSLLFRITKSFPEMSQKSSHFIGHNQVTCPTLHQLRSEGTGCPRLGQTRVRVHWFRQTRISLLETLSKPVVSLPEAQDCKRRLRSLVFRCCLGLR